MSKIAHFLLLTSLFLTSCSQKPKQPTQPAIKLTQPQTQQLLSKPTESQQPQPQQLLTPPPSQQPQTTYKLKYPAPAEQPPQIPEIPQSQPSQFPTPQPGSAKQKQTPQQITQQSTPQPPKLNLEQILNQNCDVINTELTFLTREYVLDLTQYQDAHDKLMEEQPELVYQNYLSLEIGALNLALNTIKNPSSSQYRKTRLEQIALQYLEKSHELAPDAPIDYTSEELVEAYTGLLKLREASLRDILKRALKKNKEYSTYKEMMTDIFTKEDYTKLMQQHIKAIKHIKEAFLDSRTGFKGKFPYFAAQEIRNAAKFTSQFYIDTIERYFGD